MPLREQSIPHLLDGISQRPEVQRSPTSLADSKNAFAMLGLGLMKRPPARHRGKLSSTSWDFDAVGLHTINRDKDDQFRVVVEGGQIHAFDALDDGAGVVVRDETEDGQAYLQDPTGAGFRLATIGDTTLVVNRGVEVQKGTTKSEGSLSNDAYVTVEQADFSTEYVIELAGRRVRFVTVDQVDARSRGKITTEFIAEQLEDALREGQFASDIFFDIERFGSTIRIASRTKDKDFEIDVEDGLGGNGLHLAKTEVQDVEDLPPKAKQGAILKVTGDPRREQDDFFVWYDATVKSGSEHGVWKESVAPGVLMDFDASTMPHALVLQGPLLEPGLVNADLPSRPKIETITEEEQVRGYTDKRIPFEPIGIPTKGDDLDPADEEETSVPEEADDIIERHKERRRVPVPGADGTERDVDAIINVDTSLVRTGLETRVNLSKVDSLGSRSLLTAKSFRPGDTFQDEVLKCRKVVFDEGDEIEIELEYGDGIDQPRDRRAELEMAGNVSLIPQYETVRLPTLTIRKRRFVEVTYESPSGSWPEGTEIRLELDGLFEFTHIVTSGGQTNAQVAASVAGLIDSVAEYQATAATNVVTLSSGDLSTYPIVTNTETELLDSVFFNPDMELVEDELVGMEAINITDGSVATITSNSDTTITASLSGGADNAWAVGDEIRVEGTNRYFVFRPIGWDLRQAGDDKSNEFPSFTESTITDVFFHRNRLGFTSGESVSLSRNGDLFQFFRTSVVDVQDDDRIDVSAARPEVALFHSAFEWNGDLHLWSEAAQFVLGSGDDLLSPKTVAIDVLGTHQNDPDIPPVVGGQALYFATESSGYTRVKRFVADTQTLQVDVQDLTRAVPTLLPGAPRGIAVDADKGIAAVNTKGDPRAVHVYTWTADSDGLIHAGWNRWELPSGTTVGKLDMVAGALGIISSHGTDGVYLADIGLNPTITPDGDEGGRYLDRRVDSEDDDLSPTLDGGLNTTWTLPYVPQSPDDVRVFRRDTNGVLNPTVNGTSVSLPGDLVAVPVWIGVVVPFEAKLSPIRIIDQANSKETRGLLQLTNLELHYHDTTDLVVEWTPEERSPYTVTVDRAAPGDGVVRAPLMANAETTVIRLLSPGAGGARVSGYSWEGRFNRRSRSL